MDRSPVSPLAPHRRSRVVGINHKVNSAGELIRIVTLGPVRELQVVPWDPRNPNDDGIVRARP